MPVDTPTEPSEPAAPARATPVARPHRPVMRATAVVAVLGAVAALVALALLARPLETPTQDCGTAVGFLLDGRVNEFADPADPPAGASRADAEANNAQPCQSRAADRAKPAGALLVAGTAVGVTAALVEATVRLRRRRARHRAAA